MSATSRPSAGCGMDPVSDTSIAVNGMRASYLLDLPVRYDKTRAYPLLLAFREASTTTDAFRASIDLASTTGMDAVVVYPNCVNNAATWDAVRDISLIDVLLPKLEADLCIDRSRVFVLGHGAGASFATAVGCFRGDALRGVAPLSSAAPPGGCVGAPAAWILQGSMEAMNVVGLGRGNRDYWVTQSGCTAKTLPVAPAPCVEYTGCNAGSVVRYCEHTGNDSTLPSFASAGLWSFFSAL
jgi:poly(3-hydroxybutyrate) depolymerase